MTYSSWLENGEDLTWSVRLPREKSWMCQTYRYGWRCSSLLAVVPVTANTHDRGCGDGAA